MTFYHYGPWISKPNAVVCIYYAIGDAVETHSEEWFDPIGESDLLYQHEHVKLTLIPGTRMTWSMWFRAAVVLGIFINEYNCLAFDYEVEVQGEHRVIGSGSLSAWR